MAEVVRNSVGRPILRSAVLNVNEGYHDAGDLE